MKVFSAAWCATPYKLAIACRLTFGLQLSVVLWKRHPKPVLISELWVAFKHPFWWTSVQVISVSWLFSSLLNSEIKFVSLLSQCSHSTFLNIGCLVSASYSGVPEGSSQGMALYRLFPVTKQSLLEGSFSSFHLSPGCPDSADLDEQFYWHTYKKSVPPNHDSNGPASSALFSYNDRKHWESLPISICCWQSRL